MEGSVDPVVDVDKPARLIIRLLFGFVSDSVFVKLNKNENKYWDGNAVYTPHSGKGRKKKKKKNVNFIVQVYCIALKSSGEM